MLLDGSPSHTCVAMCMCFSYASWMGTVRSRDGVGGGSLSCVLLSQATYLCELLFDMLGVCIGHASDYQSTYCNVKRVMRV